MTRLAELLEDAVGVDDPRFSVDDVHRRVGQRRTRRRVRVVVASVCVVALVVGVVAWSARGNPTTHKIETVATPPPRAERALFASPTGTTLLFDDGYDGITAFDLDHGVVTRRVLEGQAAGDQPYRSLRSGDSLVVGWGPVSAVPLSGAPSRVLDPKSTIAVPAAEPGAVWLADYPGGCTGCGVPTFRLVRVDGTVLAQGTGPDSKSPPVQGVPGGLALQTEQGLALWYPSQGVLRRLGTGVAFTLDVHGSQLAWCPAPCTTLHLSDVVGGSDKTVPFTPGTTVDFSAARFSPDGARLAVPVHKGVALVDTRTLGLTTVLSDKRLGQIPSVGWSRDGTQLFAASNSYAQSMSVLARYDLRTKRGEVVTLPVGGLMRFVTATNGEVANFLRAPTALPIDCPAPPVARPRADTKACTFGVKPR